MLDVLLLGVLTQPADRGGLESCRSDLPAVAEIRAVATGIIEADNARALERVLGCYASHPTSRLY